MRQDGWPDSARNCLCPALPLCVEDAHVQEKVHLRDDEAALWPDGPNELKFFVKTNRIALGHEVL